jgi:peptide/nickel transport system permease protein
MIAIPGFWLASRVSLLGSLWFDYVPPLRYIKLVDDPWGNIRQFFVPALLLALASSGVTMRMTRTMMLEVLRQDYVRTARAKGLRSSRVILRHAMRNACLPVITVVGLQFGVILGGAVIFEQIFQLPGLGQYMLEALRTRDYPVIEALTIILASFVVVTNFLVDLCYAWLDPRVSYS